MDNVPGAPLPPEPSLSMLEFSLICTAIGVMLVLAGIIVLVLEKIEAKRKGRR